MLVSSLVRTTAEPTAYQKHVKKFAKTYKGKMGTPFIEAAAKAWKKTPGSKQKKAPKSSPKNGGKKTMGKKKTTKKGFRLPGGLGPKGILTGALGLAIVPRFLPIQSPGAKMLGTGLALRALNLGGGGALSSVGLILTASEFLMPYIGGFIGGAGAPSGNAGGFDY